MLLPASQYPPANHYLRPERQDRRSTFPDKVLRWIRGNLIRITAHRHRWMPVFVKKVERYGQTLAVETDAGLVQAADRLRLQFLRAGMRDELVARAFALVREAAFRTLSMRHFPSQIVGGRIMLQGMVAEMETGEGKTLTATLSAGTAALAGVPVHVITVNDYLTQRDAEWMRPVYEALGISIGYVVHGMMPADRRSAYGCDVTYCTNKEITFDYLRDWITLEGRPGSLRLQAEYLYGTAGARADRMLLRGLHFAIVDEADSVLVDEARTPLIISRPTEASDERTFLEQAVALAGSLEEGVHYRVDRGERKVDLTDDGRIRIKAHAEQMGLLWTGAVRRDETVRLALTANALFRRDEQYLVLDGKVQIVDEFTGRVMPDRSYEGGLQQLIEIKEGCDVTQQSETQARISYQRFFRRYLHLAGMTGTAREVNRELWSVYGLPVVAVPTHNRLRRKGFPDAIFMTQGEKWDAVSECVRQEHELGRPVLVGTRSVAASEKASQLLADMGLEHQVLNAKQDREEADIIARAGLAGSITIATNMAGRGTDIKLGEGIEKTGGLHVILTERHEAGRIDRQLSGRCARQGDPGSYQAILSLEDPLLDGGRGGVGVWLARWLPGSGSALWAWNARRTIRNAQKKIERRHARIRHALLKDDERRGETLSFSGRLE